MLKKIKKKKNNTNTNLGPENAEKTTPNSSFLFIFTI